MPHALIEHSDLQTLNLTSADLLEAVFSAMQASGLFSDDDIKVRRRTAEGERNGTDGFSVIHIQLRIMPGRTTEQKQALSRGVLDAVLDLPHQAGSTSVEVVDIDKSSYAKRVI